MTLLDAPTYDPAKARMRKNLLIAGLVTCVVLAGFLWYFWNWPQEHRVNQFFAAIEAKDLPKAFGIWNHDPDWQQHPQQYAPYDFAAFQKDWGPSNQDYGQIKSHTIFISHRVGNGVVMGLYINGVQKPLFLRVDSKAKTIGFSPVELSREP